MRSTHVWLLLTAVYSLVNANAKWQNRLDSVMVSLGFSQFKYIPQLFYKKRNGKLILIMAKIVDDLKAAGCDDNVTLFLRYFDKIYKFGDINHGPGKVRYFGINTIEHQDSTVETNADDKLDALEGYRITR